MTDAGPKDLIDDNDDTNTDDQSLSLPGVLKGEKKSWFFWSFSYTKD